MIRVITSPRGTRVSPKLEGARARKEKAARNGSTKVSQNTKVVGIEDLGRRRNKLTQDDIGTSDTKIDKTPNKMTISNAIIERLTISGA